MNPDRAYELQMWWNYFPKSHWQVNHSELYKYAPSDFQEGIKLKIMALQDKQANHMVTKLASAIIFI